MALLTPQAMSRSGLNVTYSAVNSTDTIAQPSGSVLFLHVKNANAASCTVTIADGGKTPAGSSAQNPTVSVPSTTGDRMIGPIPGIMADPTTGLVTVSYSVTASVTAALVAVPTG